MKKHEKMSSFIAEQNRFMRTGGLPADHPEGQIEPGDYPLAPAERRFWEREERLYQEMINDLHRPDVDE